MPAPTYQIEDVIVNKLVLDLEEAFAEVLPEEKPGIIRAGRLQDDPEDARITVLVHVGDPDDDNWLSASTATRDKDLDRNSFKVAAFEVGGGQTWWRRGTVEMQFFGTQSKESRDDARRIAAITLGRIKTALESTKRVPGSTDEFSEAALILLVVKTTLSEGGGPPDAFIWRGKVWWQVLTGRVL